MSLRKSLLTVITLFALSLSLYAQDRIGTISVRVALDHSDWRYEFGQPVKFTIGVIQDGQPVPNARVTYKIGLEAMPPTM